MNLFILVWALACSTAPPGAEPDASGPGPYLLSDVPAYPGLRKVCSSVKSFGNGDQYLTMYASRDALADVKAFYDKNRGRALAQPSGPRVILRATKDQIITIGPPGSTEHSCGEVPRPDERVEIAVVDFHRVDEPPATPAP